MEPSPYLPTTRRFANPLYLRVERIPEYADLAPADRAAVDALHAEGRRPGRRPDRPRRRLDGQAGRAAAGLRGAARRRAGPGLPGRTGAARAPGWTTSPPGRRSPRRTAPTGGPGRRSCGTPTCPRSPGSARSTRRGRLPPLAAVGARRAARRRPVELRRAGMALGVMHDLAVGVHRGGADAWALQDMFAGGDHRRRAARRVQPARPGLAAAAVAAGPAGRDGVRAVPAAGLDRAAARRRRARRPRDRAVPAVVGPGGRGPDGGHVRALRPRGDDRHPGAGGAPGRRRRGRRGPRHGRAVGARPTSPSAASSAPRSCGSSSTTGGDGGPLPPNGGASCAWPR